MPVDTAVLLVFLKFPEKKKIKQTVSDAYGGLIDPS